MAKPARSRRSALEALSLFLLGGLGLWRFLTPRGRRSSREALEVAAADVPGEGALVLPRQRCAVVKKGQEILALDLTCPHLGCTVNATSEGFACPCHGSRFRSDGQVLAGPATRALKRLEVDERDGVVSISREEG
jgi:Rieske Fe-S protein